MKRFLKLNNLNNYPTIHITIDVEIQYSDLGVSASDNTYVNHPKNIKKSHKLSDELVTILNDIASSIITCIKSCHFNIPKHYQSKKSYAYYVLFEPVSETGEKLTPVNILISVTEHPSKTITNIEVSELPDNASALVKSFHIGDDIKGNSIGVVVAVSEICRELQKGNLSILDKFL